MIDLEERFRADVQQLPQAVHLDLGIDADALVTTGHKVRRCRILRRAASGVAALLTVGLVSFSVIANRTVAGIPEPARVPTEMTAPSTDGTASATLELRDAKGKAPYEEISLTVTRAGNDLKTVARLYDDAGMLLATEAIESRMDDPYGTVQMGVDPLWGMIPEELHGLSVAVDQPKGGTWSEYKVLGTIGVTVYAAGFDDARDATKLSTVVWQDSNDKVHQFDDTVLSTWLMDFDGQRGYFYAEPQLNAFGYHGEDGNGFSFPLSDAAKGARFYYSGTELGGVPQGMVVGLLPPGASNPTVTVANSAVKWTSLDVGNWTLVAASGESRTIAGLVTSVTYTEASGKRVTAEVER